MLFWQQDLAQQFALRTFKERPSHALNGTLTCLALSVCYSLQAVKAIYGLYWILTRLAHSLCYLLHAVGAVAHTECGLT